MIERVELLAIGIVDFCERWKVSELALFGSVVRDDFGPGGAVDELISFGPAARHTLFDIVRMEDELSGMFGRKVNLVTRAAIEGSRNHI